jgi:hypothetical protein
MYYDNSLYHLQHKVLYKPDKIIRRLQFDRMVVVVVMMVVMMSAVLLYTLVPTS